jgi:hypothetical protein
MLGAGFAGLESYVDDFRRIDVAGDKPVDAVDSWPAELTEIC